MTNTKKKLNKLFPALGLTFLIAVSSPVIALADDYGTGGSSESQAIQSTSVSSEAISTTNTTTVESESSSNDSRVEFRTMSEAQSSSSGASRQKAQSKVQLLRSERNVRTTDEQRQKVCENRKNGLQTKFTSIATNAERYQSKIDEIYAKAQAYQAAYNLPTADTTSSTVLTIEKTKAAATISVAALRTATPTSIDCKNTNVATDVTEFKDLAAQTRNDLKTYKMAVKDLLSFLRDAEPAIKPEAEN